MLPDEPVDPLDPELPLDPDEPLVPDVPEDPLAPTISNPRHGLLNDVTPVPPI